MLKYKYKILRFDQIGAFYSLFITIWLHNTMGCPLQRNYFCNFWSCDIREMPYRYPTYV